MIIRRIIILAILLSISCCLFSQESALNFFSLDIHDGLSDNLVTGIVKDPEGYLWISTQNGLNRFDGSEFKVFKSDTTLNALPDNAISDLFLTESGELWLGYFTKGVAKYQSLSQTFQFTGFEEFPGTVAGQQLTGFAEDTDTNLYIATTGNVFMRSDEAGDLSNITNEIFSSIDSDDLGDFNILAITHDEEQGIWLVCSGDLFIHYNHESAEVKYYPAVIPREEPINMIQSMIHFDGKLWIGGLDPEFYSFDPATGRVELLLSDLELVMTNKISLSSDSLLWLSTTDGLIKYNPENRDYHRYMSNVQNDRSLSTSRISCFLEDEQQVYWIGLENSGINYAFGNLSFQHLYQGEYGQGGLFERNISALFHDQEGNFWIGYSSGLIERHDAKTGERHTFSGRAMTGSSGSGAIFNIFQDREGTIYFTSWRGGIQQFNRHKFQFEPLFGNAASYQEIIDGVDIRDVTEDSRGRLWLTVHGFGVYVVDRDKREAVKLSSTNIMDSLFGDWVYQVEIDHKGYAWITSAWGLTRVSTDDFSSRRYDNSDGSLSLTDNPTRMLTIDNHGNVWVGNDQGLNLYDREDEVFHKFTTKNGLPDPMVRALIQDKNDRYWVSTLYRIVSFELDYSRGDPSLSSMNMFSIHDGLLQEGFAFGGVSSDPEGRIYFGGRDGIDYFNPDEIKLQHLIPNIKVSNLKVYDREIFPGSDRGPEINSKGEVELHHTENMISIGFSVLNYIHSNEISFSYKLFPITSDWVSLGNERKLVLSNLAPGHYRLSVRLETVSGEIYENSDLLKLYIEPPFWKRLWFKLLVMVLLLFIILGTVWRYTDNLRKKKDLLESQVRERTVELKEKNMELEAQAEILQQSNKELTENKIRIENQAEELKNQSEQLARNNAELHQVNALKDKFFSIIAHDLKNPFNVILGFAELLNVKFDEYTDEEKKQRILHIREASNSAYALLENLLQWSRSQSGRLKVHTVEIPVSEVFKKQAELFKSVVFQKNIDLKFETSDRLTVKGDSDLLSIILRNLVSNAYKFTRMGGSITVSAKSAGKGLVEFCVKDNGMGMKQEEIQKLFRIDQSVSKAGTAGETGTGLGLILCKEFVEKMHGRISVESAVGTGTTVRFSLPGEA
ncbi:MAG: hypothetical protein K9J30_03440 [Bacteroidales bacterium]|nr:hypothetical protein [Bacteroidales bacterium]